MASYRENYKHDYATLKHVLHGAECYHALRALAFAEEYHQGLRKDGKTPNFHHQVKIAFTLYDERERIKAAGLDLDEIIAEGILHDTYEDNQSLQLATLERHFNARITEIVTVLSKIRNDVKIPTRNYYEEMLLYPEAIIVKLHDRRNNVETLRDLPPEKQADYVVETRHFLAVAKRALDMYPNLTGLIQHSRKQIKDYLDIYLGFARKVKNGSAAPIITALNRKGLLAEPNAPRPSSRRGRIRRPAAP